ncbi:uroporphyrinogen-III C-methyltransferase [Marinihelvus fidelis]|uniref:uroporphyrinogen-III C-methyltransferase n=1 Tax=Marinihelvus fidelis TaxID=2613842 RepID=UPI00177E8027|nr:uroporphyrinogen-III C-methyltransferase [Marinihelvus fidelis]
MNTEIEEQEFDPFARELEKARRGSAGTVAWLALLLALGVAGFVGWQWWQDSRAPDPAATLHTAVADVRQQLAALERHDGVQDGRIDAVERRGDGEGVRALQNRVAELGSGVNDLSARVSVAEQAQADTQQRLRGIESGFSAVLAREQSPTRVLELDEIDHLLRVASERARLYADPDTADGALALADAQLQAIDDPLYLPVRQAIATTRQHLQALERVDTVAVTEQLGALQGRVIALPFPGDEPAATEAVSGEESPGLWARFKASLAGLVTVRRTTGDKPLGLEDRDFLRQALWLQLETARLALMRRDQGMYDGALDRAGSSLNEHFDTSAATVREFNAALATLGDVNVAPAIPDVSAPWTRLQRLRTAAPAPAPVTPPGPADEPDVAEDTETSDSSVNEGEPPQ